LAIGSIGLGSFSDKGYKFYPLPPANRTTWNALFIRYQVDNFITECKQYKLFESFIIE